MASDNLNKAYESLMKRRQANIDRNTAEGRTINMTGKPLNPDLRQAADTLSDLRSDIVSKGGFVQNLENTIKSTPSDTMGISPEIIYKSRFPSTSKALKLVEDLPESGMLRSLKNNKGFAKMLPMLGLGAAGLAGLSIAGKVQAGELGEAGMEAADLGTDYVPGLGSAKMALRPTELGNAELPDEMMREREVYNSARKAKNGEPVNTPSLEQPLLAPENRIKKEDLDKLLESIKSKYNQ